ncbi:MAG: FAD:protein FMN transferase [Verrucomicrobia bacterium]|nr:FAD:protein FMN transferase [Verrucomicrobiota bacterium]
MQRRRFLKILAAGSGSLSFSKLQAAGLQAVHWKGYAFGAVGRFTLYTDKPESAKALLEACFKEIQRLERVFSLYDHRSEICQLNRCGRLENPDPAWFPLLNAIDRAHALTNGTFDPTIQTLWQCYSRHYLQHPESTNNPAPDILKAALDACGWEKLRYDKGAIQMSQPTTQISLNGIAQGYITDRVSEILKSEGYSHVLVELGETRALGPHPQQRPWRLAIPSAEQTDSIHTIAELDQRALATSAANGSSLSKDSAVSHLIDPRNGIPAPQWKSVSVLADSATEADALSTGLSFATLVELDAIRARRSDLEIITQT